MIKEISHRELCIKAARFLRAKGIQPFHKCTYSVCELERNGECPDAYGWGNSSTALIEVKISRSDFLADKRKLWRKHPSHGLGRYRSYLCPFGLISKEEIPDNWGLLYFENNNIIKVIEPQAQESNFIEEINLISSILRRENIKPQMFNYKKYKSKESIETID